MKKYIIFLLVGILWFSLPSCLERYLDKAPESGLTKADVFTKYENFIKYFNQVYTGYYQKWTATAVKEFNLKSISPLYWCSAQTFAMESLTPMTDQGWLASSSHMIKNGVFSPYWIEAFCYNNYYPILASMFAAIRVCNTTLQNIDMLTDGAQEDKDDLVAQAYFVRGLAHFELTRYWGGMPYITKVIGDEDQWDIPRLTSYETLVKVAADMDTAVVWFEKAGRMRRDPGPGQVGHLTHPEMYRVNGVAAKAYKARALLYAASPLNNAKGTSDWEAAAIASWEAIKVALQYNYALLSAADYKKNFVGSVYTNEMIWGWYYGSVGYTSLGSIIPSVFSEQRTVSGHAPSQNTVDMFETKWGDPLNTQEDRDAATALGNYNEQDPYKDRDPRFGIDIIYNQCPLFAYGKAEIWFEMVNGTPNYGFLLDPLYLTATHTGYLDNKHWGGQSVKNKVNTYYTDPLMRLGELYLDYAEAANEAYGPNNPAPGADMTAVQAANTVRNRIGQSDIPPRFTATSESLRPRLKNERNVELVLEGHYYHDIRRWMDAPEVYQTGVRGVEIEKVPVSTDYPSGFKYTRTMLPAIRQSSWKPQMYYFPFTTYDQYKMKSFKTNPDW